MKQRETQKVAIRIVRAHLADMGGPECGWTYDSKYRRLAQAIERALLDGRGGSR